MLDSNRFLVIHRDTAKAQQVKTVLERAGFRAACIHSGMEGVPKFETFKPGIVLIETGLTDMPVPVLVQALREMHKEFPIWLLSDDPNEATLDEARAIGAYGVLQCPISVRDLPRLNTQELEDLSDISDETLNDFVPNHIWQEQPTAQHHTRLIATEVMQRGSLKHKGHLVIIGDLEGVKNLYVDGDLSIQGSVRDCHIRCRGNLLITGALSDCREPGVFARANLSVGQIQNAHVVAGKNLFLKHHCIKSAVYVMQHMVAFGEDSRLVGGIIRVCEHIGFAIVGDAEQTHTQIELAPPLLHESWQRTKKHFWKHAVSINNKLAKTKGKAIRKHLEDPRFYVMQAELIASRVYPGVSIRIGKFEDYIFESYREPTRIFVGLKHKKAFGICARPRKKKKAHLLKKEA
ncbi:FapA family protein [Acanthopleuribacter pedis]|uniref:DUF342 domain-containing protein n=1 Tax=Acanthopleuribacter pedis TaxID=442870 RepID=A0A8J7QID0_9BACT|nr:FapA family protein [Acanthopleuribacter pedis]MBO1318818.1 DUF342 domain-containing protein [Acanthopleuribacter pedis]